MNCVLQRTSEFREICERRGIRAHTISPNEWKASNNASLAEAKLSIRNYLQQLHLDITQLCQLAHFDTRQERSLWPIMASEVFPKAFDRTKVELTLQKKVAEIHSLTEKRNDMAQVFPRGSGDPRLYHNLLMAVISKQDFYHEERFPCSVKTWVAHHRCIFRHLTGTLMKLRKHLAKDFRKLEQQKPIEPVPKHRSGFEVVMNKWKTFRSAISESDPDFSYAQSSYGDEQAVVHEMTEIGNGVEGKGLIRKDLVSHVTEIAELNSFVEHLVFEQNDSVDQIIEDSQNNIESISESHEVLEREKKSKLNIYKLTLRRVKILVLFFASVLLGALHCLIK